MCFEVNFVRRVSAVQNPKAFKERKRCFLKTWIAISARSIPRADHTFPPYGSGHRFSRKVKIFEEVVEILWAEIWEKVLESS